jgi:hypothetical protein
MSRASLPAEVRAPWPIQCCVAVAYPVALRAASYAQWKGRARCVLRAAWREATLEHDHLVGTESQMRKTHRLHRSRDRTRVNEVDVLPNASDRHVRAERFVVEPDRAAAKLRTNVLAKGEQVRRACTEAKPDDSRTPRWREATGAVELDVECGDAARGCLGRGDHVSEPLVRALTEERQRDVHELRLHAA